MNHHIRGTVIGQFYSVIGIVDVSTIRKAEEPLQ